MHRKYLRKWSKLSQLGEVYSNKHPVGSITTQETSGLKGYPEGDGEQKKERHSRHWSCCWLLRSAFVFMIISKMTTQQVLPWPPLFSPPVVHSKSSNKWNVFLFFFPNMEYWSGLLRRILPPSPVTTHHSIQSRTFVNTPFQQLLAIIILTFAARFPLFPFLTSLATSRFLFFLFQFPWLRLRFDLCTFKRFAYCFCA